LTDRIAIERKSSTALKKDRGRAKMTSYLEDVEAVRRIAVVPTILETVCRLTGMGFAAVARVTDERWVACSVKDDIGFGLKPGGELKLETTICHEIRQSGDPVIISDVHADPVFSGHHTPAMYGFRSYISMPITLSDGAFFGTLCAIDPHPRDLGRPEIQNTFRMFADLLGFHLDVADRLTLSEGQLASAVEAGELREQFIAVLGHDLRNPLAAIQAGIGMLQKGGRPKQEPAILRQMQHSVDRMARLIDNILDFARGRLGGGFSLDRNMVEIEALIRQVVAELTSSHPDQEIVVNCDAGLSVRCDPGRMGQVLSNLIGNALTHGAAGQPVVVRCHAEADQLLLSVANGGNPIPEAARASLFQPFVRGRAGTKGEGLGLGLYITAQIAAAHGGTVRVDSSAAETCFTVILPLD
jgi:signal transduction histidine kinase